MQRSLVLPLTVASWTLGLPYRLMAFANAQSARQVAAVILLSFLALPSAYRAWQIPVTAFTWAVLALLGRIAIANAVTALAPWQQAAAWRGWAVLATLALAVGWACAYWEWAAEIDAWCGWMPAASLGESLLRKSLLGLWGPLFLLLLVNARLGRDHGSSA